MAITIPIRKGLRAKYLAENRPDLSRREVARIVGSTSGAVLAAMKKEHFGRDKPKSRAQ